VSVAVPPLVHPHLSLALPREIPIGTSTSLPDLVDILALRLREVAIPASMPQDVTVILAEVVGRLYAVSETESIWNRLSARLQQLCDLVSRICSEEYLKENIRSLLEPIIKKLTKLSWDMRKTSMSKQRLALGLSLVAKLFNIDNGRRVSVYEKRVDRLNNTLTDALCSRKSANRAQRMSLKQRRTPLLETPAGSFEMSNNHGLDIGGSVFSGLQFAREMRVQIHHNSAVKTGGDAFCNIDFR